MSELTSSRQPPQWLHGVVTNLWDWPGPVRMRLITRSENWVFRVSTGTDPVGIVRVQRPGYVGSLDEVTDELAWVEALASESDVIVAPALATRDGRRVVSVTPPTTPPVLVSVFPHLTGHDVTQVDPSTWFGQLGSITAQLHRHARAWVARRGGEVARFSWDGPSLLGPQARWGVITRDQVVAAGGTPEQAREVEDLRERLLGDLLAMPRDDAHWGLIHADLHRSNLLVDDSGRLQVIDFDDCGWGWLAYDLAASLGTTALPHRARPLAQLWLEGYSAHDSLDDRTIGALSLLTVVRQLARLAWVLSRDADVDASSVLADVLAVSAAFRASRTWLTD